jgi:uncharacterized membrane protein
MADSHSYAQSIAAEFARLNEMERHIIDRFIRRERVARDITARTMPLGDRVADKVAAFGGSWTFISIAVAIIVAWMVVNALITRPFDTYPYILLNLVLSCLAALQAPIIMMSQNRQAAHDRLDAQHDYEINIKAELEIVALHAKLDEIRDQKWMELMKAQQDQLELLTRLCGPHRAT